MYYDEQVIDGVLCHRGTPDGEWTPFTAEQLTTKLQEAKAAVKQTAVCNCAGEEWPLDMIGLGCQVCGTRIHRAETK
jgi:hypothetical protein